MEYMYDALMFFCIFVIQPYTLPKFNSKFAPEKMMLTEDYIHSSWVLVVTFQTGGVLLM